MAYLTQKHHGGAVIGAFGGMIDQGVQAWKRYRTYQQTYNELSRLSSRELEDLGISRSMISRLAAEAASAK